MRSPCSPPPARKSLPGGAGVAGEERIRFMLGLENAAGGARARPSGKP
jgi:hypothetical protein